MKTVQNIKHFSSGIFEPYIFISYSHDENRNFVVVAIDDVKKSEKD